jgi:hypothetical protein
MISSPLLRAVILAGLLTLTGQSVQAAEPTVPADPEPWRIGFTSYVWMPSISGSITTRGQNVDLDADMFQRLKQYTGPIDVTQQGNSMAAFMGYFEADKGPAGFYADLIWTKAGFSRDLTAYRQPLPGLQLNANVSATGKTEMTIAEVGGLFELQRWPGSDGSYTAVDAEGGFRYWNFTVGTTLDATGSVSYPDLGIDASHSLGVSISNTVQWVDPLIGLRLRHRFTDYQDVLLRGDIGGFGLGSQFSWQLLAAYTYRWKVSDSLSVAGVLGYRALSTNYSSGSGFGAAGMNLLFHGPLIGFGVRF